MKKNFWIYVDREGKMPQLRHLPWVSENFPWYIRYVNNRPVAIHGPADVLAQDVTRTKVWNYANNTFIPIDKLKSE